MCRGVTLETGSLIPGTGSGKGGYPGDCGCTPEEVLGGVLPVGSLYVLFWEK